MNDFRRIINRFNDPNREGQNTVPKDSVGGISSDALSETDVVAHLDADITYDRNLVYCASFQIVWNQLADEMIKAPPELEGNPLLGQALNRRQFDKQDISQDCYLAVAGFGRDGIVEQIKQGLEEKFHRESGFDLALSSPDDILAYAYLEKALPFDTIFDVFDTPLLFSDGIGVQSFGIEKGDAAADQVVVLDYRDPDDFIVKLQGSPIADEALLYGLRVAHPRITDDIILAKVTPQPTLLKTIDNVLFRISEEGHQQAIDTLTKMGRSHFEILSPRLDSNVLEIFQIPKITFNILHRFSEIVGKHLLNRGFEKYFIAQALQATKFKLDETGADLSSEGFMRSFGIHEEPRRFIFDKPFLLCLKEKQAHYPYLAVWIGNSELLVRN